jgi:hypothetical protein
VNVIMEVAVSRQLQHNQQHFKRQRNAATI